MILLREIFSLIVFKILIKYTASELSRPGEECYDDKDCSSGVKCIQDQCLSEPQNEQDFQDQEATSSAFRSMTSLKTFLTLIPGIFNSPYKDFVSATCSSKGGPPRFICEDSNMYSYECPIDRSSPSVLIEFTWPGCNKDGSSTYGKWKGGILSCNNRSTGLNSITGLYMISKSLGTINNRPVYIRKNKTNTGATLYLFHKDESWHIIARKDGLSNDPSYTSSTATVSSDSYSIETIDENAIWYYGYASTWEIVATTTCSDEVLDEQNMSGSASGGTYSGSGGSSGGNCNAGCCLSCNMGGCPSCCC